MSCKGGVGPGGAMIFMCKRRFEDEKRDDCKTCGKTSTMDCGFILKGKMSGQACGRLICDAHAEVRTIKGEEVGLCPPHAKVHDNLRQKRSEAALRACVRKEGASVQV